MNVKERHVDPAPPTVTIEHRLVAGLIEAQLDQLWLTEQEEACCPTCCRPCWVLKRLLDLGQLDDLVRPRAAGNGWWDAVNGQVDRVFLAAAWRRTDCAHQHPHTD